MGQYILTFTNIKKIFRFWAIDIDLISLFNPSKSVWNFYNISKSM